MQRKYALIDVVVAVGMLVTIVSGGLLFMAASGFVSFSRMGMEDSLPSRPGDGLQQLQPVLGLAIVDQTRHERQYVTDASIVGARLYTATNQQAKWQNSPFGYLDSIKASAVWAEAEHAARVQTVMGRSIVNFTRRGVRSGGFSSEKDLWEFNNRMIETAEASGQRMDAQFVANWQSNLGRAIVVSSQSGESVSALNQQRLGVAIVQVALIQDAYETRRAAIQEQLGGATVVALRTESQRVFSHEGQPRSSSPATMAATHGWPDLPMSAMGVASIVLMGLFIAGLLFSPRSPSGDDSERVIFGSVGPAYSRTA